MRICKTCGLEKSLENDFYSAINGRHELSCKVCRSLKMALQKRENYDPKKERRKFLRRKKHPNYKTGWEKWAKKYPIKQKARQMARNAVKAGKLLKLPCEVCGDLKSQGHHEDYNKPLAVIWLCTQHHKEKHYGTLEEKIKKIKSLTKHE